LRDAIDSALAQTYENREVIVVNDGSTDGTEQICLGYGERIRYFAKENGGVATALNLGIEKMRGEYFSWLSHDDMYYPRKVEAQIAALKRDGDMRKVVLGDCDVLFQGTGIRKSVILKDMCEERHITDSVCPVVRGMIMGCALLIHRSHFERVGLFDPKLHCVQDYDLWFRILRGQKSLYVNELLYTQRRHDEQDQIAKASLLHREEIELWKGYTNKLTDEEIVAIYGSRFLFLFEMWRRMKRHGVSDEELSEKFGKESELQRLPERIKGALRSLCRGKDPVVHIFGAGDWGLWAYYLLRFCNVDVRAFIDNDRRKHGATVVDGVPCISFAEAEKGKSGILVVVAIRENADVSAQLRDADFPFAITKNALDEIMVASSKPV
jgi:glycosyltransferase involved in cell wall biosynthesis